MAAITLRRLTKRFGPVTAVADLSLDLQEGELVAFLGPSGCGKTTTLRMIAGFEYPTAGEILLGGRSVVDLPPERRNTGMVFQNYALFPHLTVGQNVSFGLEMRRVPRAEAQRRVRAILEKVQLGGLEDRYPRQLSGGQQQRVALARALVINPSVLLLDEPLANLDAKLREEMRFYIRSLQREFGITTIYVTHDQAEAMVLADRIAVMMNGSLQQFGPPQEIYRRPRSRRVAEFIGLSNFIPGRLEGGDGELHRVRTEVGVLRCLGQSAAPGTPVLVSVRPEALLLEPDGGQDEAGDGGENRMRGVVRESAYLGNLVDYRVEVIPELVLRVQADPRRVYNPGERVRLRFDPAQAWLVPGDAA